MKVECKLLGEQGEPFSSIGDCVSDMCPLTDSNRDKTAHNMDPGCIAAFGHRYLHEPRGRRSRKQLMLGSEVVVGCASRGPLHAHESACGIVPEVPFLAFRLENQTERLLLIGTWEQRQGLIQSVAQAYVDIPDAGRVLVRRVVAHREHEMISNRSSAMTFCTMYTSHVVSDGIAKRSKEQAERTIEVVAVATPALGGDSLSGSERIDSPFFA